MPVNQKDFDEFKIQFSQMLFHRSMTCEQVAMDTDAKTYIENFVTDNIINKKIVNDLQSIVYRLANMEVSRNHNGKVNDTILYPVINKYKGHDLLGSYFFEKTDNGVREVFVEVKQSGLLLS